MGDVVDGVDLLPTGWRASQTGRSALTKVISVDRDVGATGPAGSSESRRNLPRGAGGSLFGSMPLSSVSDCWVTAAPPASLVWLNPDPCLNFRCKRDAAFFHLYGITRDDVGYIMETFPIVRRNDEKKFGDYRTKLLILDIYDRMQGAITTGRPYETVLDPPPADPRCCHPAKECER